MIEIYKLLFSTIIITIIIYLNYFYRHKISNFLGVVDKPDKIRKFHKKKTPLIGSFPLIFSILIFNFFFKYENIFFINIIFISVIFFLIGLVDDKYNIKYQNKFFLTFFVTFVFLLSNDNFLISSIYFETFNINKPLIKLHSMLFTIICVIILINTFNFTDGINGLSSYVAIIWIGSLILVNQNISLFLIFIIICTILNSIPIIKGYYFLGDSGTLFLSSVIAFSTIIIFNNSDLISYEKIFLIFMIPGLDMIRLIFARLKNKKNPFLPDRYHLHHFLIKKYSLYQSLLIYSLLMILPIMLYYIIGVQLSIMLGGLLYFFTILKLKKT